MTGANRFHHECLYAAVLTESWEQFPLSFWTNRCSPKPGLSIVAVQVQSFPIDPINLFLLLPSSLVFHLSVVRALPNNVERSLQAPG